MAKFYIKRLKTRAILSRPALFGALVHFGRNQFPAVITPVFGADHSSQGPARPVVRRVHPRFIRLL